MCLALAGSGGASRDGLTLAMFWRGARAAFDSLGSAWWSMVVFGEEAGRSGKEMSVAEGAGLSRGPMTVPRIKSLGATRRFWPRRNSVWHFAPTPASAFSSPASRWFPQT